MSKFVIDNQAFGSFGSYLDGTSKIRAGIESESDYPALFFFRIILGPVAEWLGWAAQQLILKFESWRDLKKSERV